MCAKMNYRRTQDQVRSAKESSTTHLNSDTSPYIFRSSERDATWKLGRSASLNLKVPKPIGPVSESIAPRVIKAKLPAVVSSPSVKKIRKLTRNQQQNRLLRLHTRLGAAILNNEMKKAAVIASFISEVAAG